MDSYGISLESFLKLSPGARRILEKEIAPQEGEYETEAVYSLREAALMSGVSPDTIKRAEKDGRLNPASRDSQNRRVYSHYDIDSISATLHR